MIRFYCTVCKKVKRARRQPQFALTAYYLDGDTQERVLQPDPKNRPARCGKHALRENRNV
jgi:hypothetical protein